MKDSTTIERLAYSPLEAAAALGVSKNLIYSMLNSGQIHSIRCGPGKKRLIVPAEALKAFLNQGKVEVKP